MNSRPAPKRRRLLFALVFVLCLPAFAPVATAAPPPAPQDMKGYESNVGKTYTFTMTGTTVGSVWGTDTYTTDSFLTTAAVHAGVLERGATREVEVMVVPGQPSYKGSSRNGVTTSDWGAYEVSFRFAKKGDVAQAPAKPAATPETPAAAAPAKKATGERAPEGPSNMYVHKDEVGKTFRFTVKGSKYGTVYGTGTYTIDSYLATAAVHDGVIGIGEEAEIEVTVLPAQTEFKGSASNGVTTLDYSGSTACYRFKKK